MHSSAPLPPNDQPAAKGHGGARAGAGRPKGQGRWGEPTVPVRVPQSQVARVKTMLAALPATAALPALWPSAEPAPLPLPLFSYRIAAGFPSPADDYVEARIDLNRHLIRHKEATFFLRVQGDSMIHAGIHDGDLLIVDRAIEPISGKIVIAALDGELTVKRLSIKGDTVRLLPENPAYPVIEIGAEQALVIWGVVIHVIHAVG
jgi:DNA polymerase V